MIFEAGQLRGSTRELAVVLFASTVLALSAVVVPSVGHDDHESVKKAEADVSSIASALTRFMADTGVKPCGYQGSPSYALLRGPGNPPVLSDDFGPVTGSLAWFLAKNYMGNAKWLGPYEKDVPTDPWGRHYIAYVQCFWPDSEGPRGRAWVLSAGPDGRIETLPNDGFPRGDDIGMRFDD